MSKEAKNEGEGNRTADREYREAATKHAQESDTQRQARDAAETLDETKGNQDLKEAEQKGKSHAKGPASR